MNQSSQLIVQNLKLMNLFILKLALCILVLLPLISEAEYTIYLKNGGVMTGVDNVKEEAGTVKIYRGGIMLELPETNVINIEEYNQFETTEKETVEQKKTPAKERLPGYLRYGKAPYDRKRKEDGGELQQLKSQNEVLYLKTVAILEERSAELEKDIEQKIRRGYPTSAQKKREEKIKIDKQLKNLKREKSKLLDKKLGAVDYRKEIHQLKRQNISFLSIIIDVLQSRSIDAEGKIHSALRNRLPRKARIYREEKTEIDREIESFKTERDSLLK